MMKRILVATDFSEGARQALLAAGMLAKTHGASLHVVHVADTTLPLTGPDVDLNAPIDPLAHRREEKEQLKLLLALPELQGLEVESALLDGNVVWQAILQYATEKQTELLVLGKQGKRSKITALLGSNTERMLHGSKMPVLVVRGQTPTIGFQHLVIASRFAANDTNEMKTLVAFCKQLHVRISLLKVNTATKFENTAISEDRMKAFAQRFGLTNYSMHIYNHEQVGAGIADFASRAGADLVAMSTHGRNVITHLLNPSVADSVLNLGDVSLLTMKE